MGPRRMCSLPIARALVAFFALFLLGSGMARADSYQERRLRTGARLFRSLLAADQDIETKVGDDGNLLILFYIEGDSGEAEALAELAFKESDSDSPVKVRNLPVRVELVVDPVFESYRDDALAGIFLVHAPSERDLQSIIRFGIDHHVIVFSPHEGHVEKGVLGGLVIEAQVLPFINLETARESNIPIKEFFLRVAKVME